ncbi:MAG: DUF554 domain-containing protein [Lachnospiraceae bacterium]|nr:DUF554 domain-containing protein [Lachnospiraceae bacterium]
MKGFGTIINVIAVLMGGTLGILIKGGMKEKLQNILVQSCGLATLFIGISGTLQNMLILTDEGISVQGTLLLICSLVIGSFVGELIDIEGKLETAGEKLKGMIKSKNDSRFVDGFVTASLVICIGAMAVVGSLQDGLTGDYSMLLSKSVLDFIIIIVFASTMGIGVLFSALPLGIYQGLITLLAVFIAPYMTDSMISSLSLVGSALIFGVGVNLIWEKALRVGNMLPALCVPVIYELIMQMFA